jgi:pimeloyl-ACP methyl ester carboxylesterase
VTLGTEGDQEVDEQQITVGGQQLAFRSSEGQGRPVIFLFAPSISPDEARAYAEAFTAPRSALNLDEIVADMLRTDGAARAGLGASLAEDRYADEIAIVTALTKPLAILHGEGEQLVSLDYLRTLNPPTLWRKELQLIPAAGHAPHLETPGQFTTLLTEFLADL